MIDIEKILTQSIESLTQKMGLELSEIPPIEALRYFRLQEVPLLLFYIAKKNHRNTIKEVLEQYELQTGEITTYHAVRHLVRRYFDEVERVKTMEGKAKQN